MQSSRTSSALYPLATPACLTLAAASWIAWCCVPAHSPWRAILFAYANVFILLSNAFRLAPLAPRLSATYFGLGAAFSAVLGWSLQRLPGATSLVPALLLLGITAAACQLTRQRPPGTA